MKKFLLSLAILLSTVSVFAGEESVSPKVLNAFKTDFRAAKDVEWSVGQDFYKATFVYNQNHVFAYYNTEGELMGLTRYISQENLPLNLQTSLKKNYDNYWISDLFEVAKSDGTSYVITLEKADSKLILRSTNGNEWNVFEKIRKS